MEKGGHQQDIFVPDLLKHACNFQYRQQRLVEFGELVFQVILVERIACLLEQHADYIFGPFLGGLINVITEEGLESAYQRIDFALSAIATKMMPNTARVARDGNTGFSLALKRSLPKRLIKYVWVR